MPARRTPFPPLELDLDEISTVRPIPQVSQAVAKIARIAVASARDLEAPSCDSLEDLPVLSVSHHVAKPTGPRLVEPPAGPTAALVEEMNRRMRAEDFSAALVIADEILEIDPQEACAKQGSRRCQAALELAYLERLGPLSQVPVVTVAKADIRRLALDHRSGFVLALVDGTSTLDMILDMSSGMRRIEALRLLLELVQQGTLQLV
jgi:hypothetical protein